MRPGQFQCFSQSRINVVLAENLLQRCESWLSRAMARRDVVHFEAITQYRHDPLDFRIRRYDQMKAPDYEMNVWIDRGRQFGNLVDTRVGTAHNDD